MRKLLSNKDELIYRTFFADEMGIKLSEAHKKKTWQPPLKKVKTQKPVPNVKLNCWAAVCTTLKIFKEKQSFKLTRINLKLTTKSPYEASGTLLHLVHASFATICARPDLKLANGGRSGDIVYVFFLYVYIFIIFIHIRSISYFI